MIPTTYTLKLNNLSIAILIVISTQHFLVYRASQVINIYLFDLMLLMYFLTFFRSMLVIHVDSWLKLFVSMLFFQFVHNIFFSGDPLFVIKELVQGIELLIFYIILHKFFSNQNNLNKVIDYMFYGLCLLSFILLMRYFIPIELGGSEIQELSLRNYLKRISVIHMLIPIIIFSIYYFTNINYSRKKQILVFFIVILSSYIAVVSNSRTFLFFLSIVCLGYLFNFKRILLVIPLLIGILSITFIIYQDNISNKYTSEYAEKVSQTVEYITNDKPFNPRGYTELMIIHNPSNRQRLHYLKLIYQVGKNDLFFGIGLKKLQGTTNVHGNLFIYFVSYGLFNLLLMLVLISNLYITSKKNLKVLPSSLNLMKHYYLLYAIVVIFFVGGGTFPLLPFIIAAALIKSTNEPRQSDFNNYYSIGSSA